MNLLVLPTELQSAFAQLPLWPEGSSEDYFYLCASSQLETYESDVVTYIAAVALALQTGYFTSYLTPPISIPRADPPVIKLPLEESPSWTKPNGRFLLQTMLSPINPAQLACLQSLLTTLRPDFAIRCGVVRFDGLPEWAQ